MLEGERAQSYTLHGLASVTGKGRGDIEQKKKKKDGENAYYKEQADMAKATKHCSICQSNWAK